MDVITERLRAVRRDWGYWTVLSFLPALWAFEAWGAVGFWAVVVAAPIAVCLAHRMLGRPLDEEPVEDPKWVGDGD